MPKINSVRKLAIFVSGLFLAFINVIPLYRGEVVALVAGNETATNIITPTVDWITQWAVFITLVVIVGLIIWAIISFIINRHKPEETSKEVEAINAVVTELKGLRGDLGNPRGGQNL